MNRLLYRRVPVCFACGIITDRPCPGHEYGGTASAHQVRPWVHRWRMLTSARYRREDAAWRADTGGTR